MHKCLILSFCSLFLAILEIHCSAYLTLFVCFNDFWYQHALTSLPCLCIYYRLFLCGYHEAYIKYLKIIIPYFNWQQLKLNSISKLYTFTPPPITFLVIVVNSLRILYCVSYTDYCSYHYFLLLLFFKLKLVVN